MKLSALQFSPNRGDVSSNISRMDSLAADLECDLLVIPELASTGYLFTDREELLPLAERAGEGEFCRWMLDRARRGDTVVVGGFAERDERDRLFNSALIALPDGTWHVYRKTHLFYKENWIFEPGDTGFFVVEWGGARIGTMICYDWRFPESARTLALRGADVIAHPSNLVAAKSLWAPTMSTRSFENKVISITANRSGSDSLGEETLKFSGESQIVAMSGKILALASADGDEVVVAEADPAATRDKSFNPYNDLFGDRRPEFYT